MAAEKATELPKLGRDRIKDNVQASQTWNRSARAGSHGRDLPVLIGDFVLGSTYETVSGFSIARKDVQTFVEEFGTR